MRCWAAGPLVFLVATVLFNDAGGERSAAREISSSKHISILSLSPIGAEATVCASNVRAL